MTKIDHVLFHRQRADILSQLCAMSADIMNGHYLKHRCYTADNFVHLHFPIGSAVSRARRAIPLVLEDAENGLSSRMSRTIAELYVFFNDLERLIHFFDKEFETVFRQSEASQRIAKVKGIGPKMATVVVAAIGKGTEFKNGRHFTAWLGC